MSVRTLQRTDGAIFFCTYTCFARLRLIEITDLHDRIYNWMHLAHAKGFRILGFVIMPNHVHQLIHARESASINSLMSNCKRFLAYDVVARLKAKQQTGLLNSLACAVRPGDADRGQRHRVFATSTDIRECFDEAMIEQKLEYMHANPVSGVWSLVENALDYPHSSAAYYDRGGSCRAPITHYHEMLG